MKIEELKARAEDYVANKDWASLKKICTQIIKHPSASTDDKAWGYMYRAIAYISQGGYEQAIKDCDEITKLNPKDQGIIELVKNVKAQALANRAVDYINQGNHDKAIIDCNAAIKLNPEKDTKARAYLNRAAAYINQGNHDQAIKDCDEAIKLNPGKDIKADAYVYRAIAYRRQGGYEQAIKDCNAAIKLNPEPNIQAQAYLNRAVFYIKQADYKQVLKDCTTAGEYNPELIATHVYVYIAVMLKGVRKKGLFFKRIINLYNKTHAIKKELFVEKVDENEFAHYTSLTTLKSLTSQDENGSKFRLYNTAYMHDPQEGKPLFAAIKKAKSNSQKSDDLNIEKDFYQTTYPSPAYVASFVKVEAENDGKDNIMLWRAYGDDGKGACLIFQRNAFAASPPLAVSSMGESATKLTNYENPGDAPAKPQKLPLYQVAYVNETGEIVDSEVDLEELKKCLIEIDQSAKKQSPNDKKTITRLTCEILDDIRYLFKFAHFKHEQERRIAEMRYIMGEVKLDDSRNEDPTPDTAFLPKYYIDQEIPFSEIILGPCSPYSPQQWQLYLKYKAHETQKTKQHGETGKDQKAKQLDHIEITQSTIQYKPTG